MPQLKFENLRERLLRAGIAPHHVSRYLGELRDHFDDLVREEIAQGNERSVAEGLAQSRLGDESVLAETMLERPEMRSFTARYPWATFVVGPIAMLIGALAASLLIEGAVLSVISQFYRNTSHQPPPEWFMASVGIWNSLPSIVAPIAIAGLMCFVGLRQRMSMQWILLGAAIACILGGFQQLTFSDNGYHGELSFGSGLLPPFPRELMVTGIERAVANVVVVAGATWAMRWLGMLPLRATSEWVLNA